MTPAETLTAAADLRSVVLRVLRTTPVPDAPADLPFPSHHQPGETGWLSWCALCTRDSETLATAILNALNPKETNQ
jgi:hypothetical protein